ncbi:MAG TPA: hypothetical protein VKY82_01475 [Flavobacterium sp.]|nr:hypothetical protein [Flavobacterium sp.]
MLATFTLARILLDTPLSLEEPLEQFIKVYPNPFEGTVFCRGFRRNNKKHQNI